MKKAVMNEDAQLDAVIRSAWKAEDELKTSDLAAMNENDLPPVDEMTMKRVFAHARLKAESRKCVHCGGSRLQHILRRSVNVAAAVVLIAAIGLSAAMATSESFRIGALQLLLSIDAQQGTLRLTLVKPDVAAMNIPSAWAGSFYPSALPDGVRMTEYRMWSRGGNHEITFETEDGGLIVFSELHGSVTSEYSLEGASLTYMEVNGDTAFVRTQHDQATVGIDWVNDVCWLSVYTEGMSTEQAMEIARSVIYIQ